MRDASQGGNAPPVERQIGAAGSLTHTDVQCTAKRLNSNEKPPLWEKTPGRSSPRKARTTRWGSIPVKARRCEKSLDRISISAPSQMLEEAQGTLPRAPRFPVNAHM